jgi:hypothetical protein
MPTKRLRNDFINFLMDADKNPKLFGEFLSKKTPKELYRFFAEKGYEDIASNDCRDIIAARKRLGGRRIPGRVRPRCPTGPMEY